MVIKTQIGILHDHHRSLFKRLVWKETWFQVCQIMWKYETQNGHRNTHQNPEWSSLVSIHTAHLKTKLSFDHPGFRFQVRWPFWVSSFRQRAGNQHWKVFMVVCSKLTFDSEYAKYTWGALSHESITPDPFKCILRASSNDSKGLVPASNSMGCLLECNPTCTS